LALGHITRRMSEAAVDADDLRENAKRASALLKAMSNERRLLILCFLAQGEKSVGELEQLVGLSQSALSQPLARLPPAGLLGARRAAPPSYSPLAGREAQAVMATLHELYCDDAKSKKAALAAQ